MKIRWRKIASHKDLVVVPPLAVIILAAGTALSDDPVHFAVFFCLAFACEMIDTFLGMGYGTVMLPVLLFAGYKPEAIVPALLASELATGMSASIGNHLAGNVSFTFGSRSWIIAVTLGSIALVVSPFTGYFVNGISSHTLVLAIGFLIVGEGIAIMAVHRATVAFSWVRLGILGIFASFIKGISGGGYGPLVTGGQVIIGIDERSAVSITSFAETLTCVVALGSFLAFGGSIDTQLLWPILSGAVLSVPLSVRSLHFATPSFLHTAMAIATLAIGCSILLLA